MGFWFELDEGEARGWLLEGMNVEVRFAFGGYGCWWRAQIRFAFGWLLVQIIMNV